MASVRTKAATRPGWPPREDGQQAPALVIDLLRRADGATVVDLTQATGWLPHAARAALTGLAQTRVCRDLLHRSSHPRRK